jgi:7-keto-8-aminopelargonate synthetase-like enzyme
VVRLQVRETLRTLESPVAAEIVLDGRRYINFGGSSYLGLSGNAEIASAGIAALDQCGSGISIPRAHDVATRAHQQVEAEAAAFFDSQGAFYLAAGYFFGLVSLAILREEFTAIFFDELAHTSLREAIAASALKSVAFRHLDADDLGQKLVSHLGGNDRPLVVTDGMYSTFGEIAPLRQLAQVMAPFNGRLLVDESHSFGVLGPFGRGAVEHHGIPTSLALRGGSLGKAFGVCGGIIPATEAEVAAFRRAPAGRGASQGSAAAASMSARSLRFVRDHPELLQRLRENTMYMKAGLRDLGLDVNDSIAPVATFVLQSAKAMRSVKDRLMSEGIFLFHSTYIGAGAAGAIRCGIFADHTREHIDALIGALRRHL